MKATSLIPLFLILASAGRAAETTSADFYQAIRQNDLAKLKAIGRLRKRACKYDPARTGPRRPMLSINVV